MSYTINHVCLNRVEELKFIVHGGDGLSSKELVIDKIDLTGNFSVLHPGKFKFVAKASYDLIQSDLSAVAKPADDSPDSGDETPVITQTIEVEIPVSIEIRNPFDEVFAKTQITLADLKRFRNLRGVTQKDWSYTISNATTLVIPLETHEIVQAARIHIHVEVDELINSKSAPPLINETLKVPTAHDFEFDLYRVGTFTATAKTSGLISLNNRKMELIDPDGRVMASSKIGLLTFDVTLRELNKSRDNKGKVRPWKLRFEPVNAADFKLLDIDATVIKKYVIHTQAVQDRIDVMLGTNGRNFSIYGESNSDELMLRLMLNSQFTAEMLDMRGVLDDIIKNTKQDGNASIDIEENVEYTLGRKARYLDYGLYLAFKNNFKINSVNIQLAKGDNLQSTPMFTVDIKLQGGIAVNIGPGGFELASASIDSNKFKLQFGIKLNPNGSFAAEIKMNEKIFNLGINWKTAMLTGPLLALGFYGLVELLEGVINKAIVKKITELISNSISSKLPDLIARLQGDHFTHRSLKLEDKDIVFEYIAPVEPEPKPNPRYTGVIGRQMQSFGPGGITMIPKSMGDTWKADNLTEKIDHIVMVMMENRSFDHVLGYLAQLPEHKDSDGLSPSLMNFLNQKGYDVNKLSESQIKPNELGLKTKFPASVGHEFKDVTQQLSEKLKGAPTGTTINSPKGFVDNFVENNLKTHEDELTEMDVLGYYQAKDLPFYKYLVDNYTYCEKFFCSHPGPTLPNRMYSITGDLQHDRNGELIQANNSDDNFYLSRARTIFDVLSMKNVKWRVYESFPSVAMLRMFARYAGSDKIRNVSKLKQDVMAGDLPQFTVIEPGMHHYPENDDHSPDADMYNGQVFLQNVYDALRSNSETWKKTMLIITYDEHGGFYDHVNPPIADALISDVAVAHGPVGGQGASPATDIKKSMTTTYGVRVPTFVVSPWVKAGKGPDLVLDFCSILKTVLARFCGEDKPFLSDRVHASHSFESFITEKTPRTDIKKMAKLKTLPVDAKRNTKKIITKTMSRKNMRDGISDYHDMTGMIARMLGR